MKKRIFNSLLALGVALSLGACSSTSTHHASSESTTTISSSKTQSTSSESREKEEQKIAEKKKQAQLEAKKKAAEQKAKEEAERKQQEEQRKAEEQKQAEISQKTASAETILAQAESNPTRDNYNAASTAIQAIPGGNQDLSNRLANVDSTIKANEAAQAVAARVAEEQARQAAAAQVEQQRQAQVAQEEATAQAQQQNNQETVLITPTGKKYHNHVCGNGNYSPVTLKEALNSGLTACEKCFGN